MVSLWLSQQKIVAVLSVIALASASIDDSHHHDVHTTHSEVEKHVPVPVYEKVGIPIPHPVPVAVPNYVKVVTTSLNDPRTN